MAKYRLSNDDREDLIRIHHYGVRKFGMRQADRYLHAFFECFDRIATNPYHFESVDYRINNNTVEIISIIGRQDVDQKIK